VYVQKQWKIKEYKSEIIDTLSNAATVVTNALVEPAPAVAVFLRVWLAQV
jgi:hypothetical protein